MSAAWQYYFITLLVYTGVNVIAIWALNLQYGLGGILNFAFVVFQAIGAYTAGIMTLGPPSAQLGIQSYLFGASLPWPLPWLAAAAVGAFLSYLVALFCLRPKRTDYQGMVLLTVATIAAVVISNQTSWLNGLNGLVNIPEPLASSLKLSIVDEGWVYCGLTAAAVAVTYWIVHRITSSPWGRTVRAVRENPGAAEALGVNVMNTRIAIFVIGGALASMSGAVLAQFIGAWSPSAWSVGETFLYFACIIVGGLGNDFGAMLGAVLVLTLITFGVQYLPIISIGTVGEALQSMAVGLLILLFLWLRPRGLVPERRRRFGTATPIDGARLDHSARGGADA
jgi:branched-chain amino acid transport system permease protein